MHFRIIFKIAEKCALCLLDITVCMDRMAPQKSMTVFIFFLGVIAVPVAQPPACNLHQGQSFTALCAIVSTAYRAGNTNPFALHLNRTETHTQPSLAHRLLHSG